LLREEVLETVQLKRLINETKGGIKTLFLLGVNVK
jgi:hypothetical protein